MAKSQQWGWHQLERQWAERIVAAAPIRPGALVLDIGAGRGSITAHLLDAGARVIAVEAHPERARYLRERFGSEITVVQADAGGLRLPRRRYHVVANPPFAVTSPLLRRLLQPRGRLVSATLVLQDQSARRWADPTERTAQQWRHSFDVTLGPRVPRRAFTPRPQVDARVLHINRRARP